MSEPTLEEKLEALSSCDVYFDISNEFSRDAIRKRDLCASFNYRQSKKNCNDLIEAIDWLYDTAKREGYLE